MQYYLKVLQNYAVFEGRARRKEYWMFVLINMLVSFVVGFVDGAIGTYNYESGFGYLGTGYSLAVLIPSIAVGVRRMHDVGKSGWFLLIPIYNLILAVTEGEAGSNEYGPDPKNPESDLVDHLVS
ncbi:DUF805 domain-containing protein [Phaeodactylibacter xiamenensis]|jgi:uncharacterized membrane protein YhaH (DUF805 family)|uniref:DUF805 domain-containing protein n=1 Tax=Phaeodactylibacter xiamenensis TaxID=1524460 RepID=UPI0024A90F8F|nr:DUF805 domain-containing protein [Phaeodactylibacter xiamenensis]